MDKTQEANPTSVPGGPREEQSFSLVLICGLITASLALAGVYLLDKSGTDIHIMGWYANYILPVGAIIVGVVAASGYGLASWFSGIKITRSLLVIVLVGLMAAAFIYRDSVFRSVAENRIRAQSGMDVKIGKFSSSIFSRAVTIENLRLYNTAEFGGAPFLQIPELYIECDAAAFAQRKLRIKLARLNLAELCVVKNDAGQTNLFSIRNQLEGHGTNKNAFSELLGGFDFSGIEVLNLSIGKVKFVDLKDAKKNREVRVNLENQIFKNVKSNEDIDTILFMIWLRSGGKVSIASVDLSKDLAAQNWTRLK